MSSRHHLVIKRVDALEPFLELRCDCSFSSPLIRAESMGVPRMLIHVLAHTDLKMPGWNVVQTFRTTWPQFKFVADPKVHNGIRETLTDTLLFTDFDGEIWVSWLLRWALDTKRAQERVATLRGLAGVRK